MHRKGRTKELVRNILGTAAALVILVVWVKFAIDTYEDTREPLRRDAVAVA